MRKITKIISLILILVSILGICSGCMQDESTTVIRFAIPYKKDSANWKAFQVAVDDMNIFAKQDKIKVELVELPTNKKEKEKFLKDLDTGELAMFLSERDEVVDKYIKSGRLANINEMQKIYPNCYLQYQKDREYLMTTSTDVNGVNHMLALTGTYQGVFFNEDIFLENNLQIPKTWDQFEQVIDALKKAGVTPFAGGFADDGIAYWMDELVLMEGGVAEHMYMPKYGVVSSWSRALDDFKALYDADVFNEDCMDITHEEAVKMFNAGEAAMIVSPSKEVVTDDMDLDNAGVFALPVTETGKKEVGDIICDYDRGVYINTSFLKKEKAIAQSTITMVVEYLNASAEGSYEEPEPKAYSYRAYSEAWMCPADPYTIAPEIVVYAENGYDVITREEQIKQGLYDPKAFEEIVEEEKLVNRVYKLLENVSNADRPFTRNFKDVQFFIDTVKEYTLGDFTDDQKEEMLLEVTNKQVGK